jgi:hypothetical protein
MNEVFAQLPTTTVVHVLDLPDGDALPPVLITYCGAPLTPSTLQPAPTTAEETCPRCALYQQARTTLSDFDVRMHLARHHRRRKPSLIRRLLEPLAQLVTAAAMPDRG